jgi:tetratricopeptide (TPR) repeat protein
MKNCEFYNKGLEELKLENYLKAIYYFDLAIQKNKNNFYAYDKRGYSKIFIDDNTSSKDCKKGAEIHINLLNKIIIKNPYDPNIYYQRGVRMVQLSKLNLALEDFDKAIELKVDFQDAYFSRADLKSNLNDLDGAIEDISLAIITNPNVSKNYYRRSQYKKTKNDISEALIDISKAIDLEPNIKLYYFIRSTIFHELGNIQSAINDRKKMDSFI